MTHPAPTDRPSSASLATGALLYVLLLGAFWLLAEFFRLQVLHDYPVSTFLSFATLFAPYLLFGFGAAQVLQRKLVHSAARILASLFFVLPYFINSIPRHDFHWIYALALMAVALSASTLLHIWKQPANWADFAVLLLLGLIVDLGLLSRAWPGGLGGFSKLIMANIALYGYLVLKPIGNVGYDLVPRLSDLKTGLREFVFYAPFVIPVGLALGFLHFHQLVPPADQALGAWVFTFFFVALPEELFFRGLVQNLLERRTGRTASLLITSVAFGLSHFNKGAAFNWRYVLLASIAGVFYGRAWRQNRRLWSSSITHTSVDTVWSLWFK